MLPHIVLQTMLICLILVGNAEPPYFTVLSLVQGNTGQVSNFDWAGFVI